MSVPRVNSVAEVARLARNEMLARRFGSSVAQEALSKMTDERDPFNRLDLQEGSSCVGPLRDIGAKRWKLSSPSIHLTWKS